MTRAEFDARAHERCHNCDWPVTLEHNPNNNATQVVCSNRACSWQRRPWTLVTNLKTTTKTRRPPLPDGESLDSVWERGGNVCVMCAGPAPDLLKLGIGRQVHHVRRFATHGHDGPLAPICTLCHPVATDRQRIFQLIQRLALHAESVPDRSAGVPPNGVPPDPVSSAREAADGPVERNANHHAHR